MTEEIATIGHNGAPEPTPYELIKQEIEDLHMEATNWLDSTEVKTAQEAAVLNTLDTRMLAAIKKAEAAKDIEKEPYDKALKEIQARYNELIGDNKSVTGIAISARKALKAALTPYLKALEKRQEEEAAAARAVAAEAQRVALEAISKRNEANLAEREAAEKLIRDANALQAAADKAEKAKPLAKGEGRATGLKTRYVATLVDLREACRWAWMKHNDELSAFILELGQKAASAEQQEIPGFEIKKEKYA